MSDPAAPRVGGTLTADIAVPEHQRALRFYSRVLGTGAHPLWRSDLMNNRGMPIIGVGARTAEHAELPLQWMPHIQVADIAASVERAVALGGRALMHGQDAKGRSQWAVLLDPNGAAFGIIPVVREAELPSPEGVASPGTGARVGCIAWLDLTVADASATRDFYREVVGWSVQDVALTDDRGRYTDYNMCDEDGLPAAGVCHARGVNEGLPAIWLIYLPVGDLAESLRRVPEEGGRVIRATEGTDGTCTSAVVQDPAGAYLVLVTG